MTSCHCTQPVPEPMLTSYQWYSPKINFTADAKDLSLWYEFENYYQFKITGTSPKANEFRHSKLPSPLFIFNPYKWWQHMRGPHYKPWSPGVGVPPFGYFHSFSESWKYPLPVEYHVHVLHVSFQLSCGGTWQIWIWFNFPNREMDKWRFSNPLVPYITVFIVSANSAFRSQTISRLRADFKVTHDLP